MHDDDENEGPSPWERMERMLADDELRQLGIQLARHLTLAAIAICQVVTAIAPAILARAAADQSPPPAAS